MSRPKFFEGRRNSDAQTPHRDIRVLRDQGPQLPAHERVPSGDGLFAALSHRSGDLSIIGPISGLVQIGIIKASRPTAMKHFVFSSDQHSYRMFSEQICDQVVGVDAPLRAPSSFDLGMHLVQVGESRLLRIENRGEAIEVARTCRRIATDGEESWVVGICLEGSQVMSLPPGSEIAARRSELLITHTGIPHVGVTAPHTRVGVMVIPDRGLPHHGWTQAHLTAREGLARVLSESLRTLFDELPGLGAEELRSLTSSALPLISALVAPSRQAMELAGSSVREAQRRSVIRFIEANLSEPRLSAGWIAGKMRVSTRYLHAIFADAEVTVGQTILSMRLRYCRRAILDPATAHCSLFELAVRFGFSDPSHFSRAYRRHFGTSPKDDRASLRPRTG